MEDYPKQKFKEEWVQKEITPEIVSWTRSFGEYLQKADDTIHGLTTSQIRKFFGELKRIQADPVKFKENIPLLKAKLAYAVGRDLKKNGSSNTKIKNFQEELDKGLDGIRPNNNEDLNRFIKIVEAIVAYHKYFGGKDN